MKLGDNMTTVEACNVWGETCPRKTRPPRIGDIPRYNAVDEESSSPCSDLRREENMLELRLSTHGDVFSAKSSPVQKTKKCENDDEDESRVSDRTRSQGIGRSPSSPNSVITEGNETPTDARIPSVTVQLKEVKLLQLGADEISKTKEEPRKLVRICSNPSQEICEVRKDSALYLEDVEGLKDLRESLRSRSPRSLTPRRESSGYASNLGTFDEDRRPSEVDLTSVRERRRSSAKRITSETFVPRRISRNEESSNVLDIATTVSDKISKTSTSNATTFETQRKISALEPVQNMSDIFEARDDVDETDENFVGKKLSIKKNENDFSKSSIKFQNKNKSDKSNVEILSYAEVLAKSCGNFASTTKIGISNSKILNRHESIDVSDSVVKKTSQNVKILPRKRIVHQYSTPNISTTELESILEKPVENLKEIKTESETIITIEDEKNIEKLSTTQNKVLPRSVKVYQLLSTQSEDRGDGVPNLSDRRISLQITRQEQDEELKKLEDEKISDDFTSAENATTLNVPGIAADPSMRHLAPSSSSSSSSCLPVRKLSTPNEMGSSQRFPGDPGIGIRPIYPYCPYSPYGSPQGSPRTKRRPLRESRRVSIDNRQGALQLNQYKLLDNIGQGSYGIVKLAYNEEDETHYAMKILSKKKLMKKAGIFGRMAPGRKGLAANPLAKVYREIALLKKLDHPNVVKLVEVLDDPDEDNLYLVFELVEKGEVLQLPTDKPLDEETARTHFRDIVMGVEYLHYQRIVHRDIKPSNLLVDGEGRVKVADLGVSAELRAAGELLSGAAGTPAFAAPETTTPGAEYSGTLCDVWSMGVTLYSLVTGRVPWDGSGSIIGVQAAVRSEPLKFPEKPKLTEELKDLLIKMLEKEPSLRLSLSDIKIHKWVTKNGTEILPNETDNCRLPVTVTDEEVARVVTRVPKLDTLILIKTMLKQHSFQNPFLPKRITKSVLSTGTSQGERTSSSTVTKRTSGVSESSNIRAEKFHEAGRSNSAPDTFDCHLSERQVTVENQLPPVTEALVQETDSYGR